LLWLVNAIQAMMWHSAEAIQWRNLMGQNQPHMNCIVITNTSQRKEAQIVFQILKQPVRSLYLTHLSKLRLTTTEQNYKRRISVCSLLWTIPWYSQKLCLHKYTTISNSSLTEGNPDNIDADGCCFFIHVGMSTEPLFSCQEIRTCNTTQKAEHI